MAGGIWSKQNKIRPGAYINVRAKKDNSIKVGERGIATLPLILSYGPEQTILEITPDDELKDILGFDIESEESLLIRECMKKAKTLLLYRLNKGTAASIANEGLTITSKYSGTFGNKLAVIVENSIDAEGAFDVTTLLDEEKVDTQTVTKIEDLKENFYVKFSGTGELTITAGVHLAGGEDGTVTNTSYTEYLTAIETYDFDCMGLVSKDSDLKATFANYIKRLRDEEGRKVQLVVENYAADHEAVTSVKNGVKLKDGTVLASDKAVAWVTGATGGAEVNNSNTYVIYEDAVDVDIKYTDTQIKQALKAGEFVFTVFKGQVVVEQDINTLVTFTDEKTKVFRKNRVIRTLDGIANDVYNIFMEKYVMNQEDNDDFGRDKFRKDIIDLLEANQKLRSLKNVVPEDVEVTEGEEIEGVVAKVAAQPVDSMEKLYMDIIVA